MKDKGYVSLYRKIKDNPIFQDSELLHVFIYILLETQYKEEGKEVYFRGEKISLKRGEMITGRNRIALETGIKPDTIYRKIIALQKLGIIHNRTHNRYSIITLIKYGEYQDPKNKNAQQNAQQNDTKSHSQTTQSNKVNKENNITLAADAAKDFKSEEYIQLCLGSKKREDNIIGIFWNYKKFNLVSLEAARSEFKRNLKAAKDLSGYTDKQILATMDYVDNLKDRNWRWTLESVGKYIINVVNNRQ
jgi:hypothetical protein